MPQNDQELKVNEQNESLENSKKIDLYINNNDQDAESGISIMNIFSYMGKRFHIFIHVIIVAFLLGILVPLLMYEFKDKKESAISILGLNYEGAEEGKAPDGTNLDISYLKSSYIIQNALNNVILTKEVSVALVQSNLTITGVLTDETQQKLEILNKLSEDKSSEYAKLIQDFTLKYRAQYIITLKNVFEDNNKKIVLSTNDLSHLLTAITDAYREYFNDTYQDRVLPNDYIGAIDKETLDYLDILDEIKNSLDYLENYSKAKAKYIVDYRSNDGMSFENISSIIHTIKSTDIDYIYSYVYLNNVSKDAATQITNYKYQKREAELTLSNVNENINTVQTSIDNYKSDKIVISSPDSNETTTVNVTSDYYNNLVLELSDLNEQKSSLEERISILNDRITMLEGAPASADEIAKAEEYTNSALSNATSIYDIVYSHSEELFNSNAYKNQYMNSITTIESDSIRNSLKSFLIGAAAGLVIGLVAWGLDALILEIKNNREKELRNEQ